MAAVEGAPHELRPNEGPNGAVGAMGETGNPTVPAVTFNNSFDPSHGEVAVDGVEMPRERKSSRDYSHTDEWDASKVPPSRFQQRKGSVFATPSSRDGHVQRNRDNDAAFHNAHSKRFSFSKVKEKVLGTTSDGKPEDNRRKSSGSGGATSGNKVSSKD